MKPTEGIRRSVDGMSSSPCNTKSRAFTRITSATKSTTIHLVNDKKVDLGACRMKKIASDWNFKSELR